MAPKPARQSWRYQANCRLPRRDTQHRKYLSTMTGNLRRCRVKLMIQMSINHESASTMAVNNNDEQTSFADVKPNVLEPNDQRPREFTSLRWKMSVPVLAVVVVIAMITTY